jgi:hypothetical protein
MADQTDDEHQAPPPAPASEPEWASALRRTIEELPGKLVASVTDDDKRSIAETVHDLFDGSGAFKTEEQQAAETETKEETVGESGGKVTPDEAPPKKHGRFSHIAQKFAGD